LKVLQRLLCHTRPRSTAIHSQSLGLVLKLRSLLEPAVRAGAERTEQVQIEVRAGFEFWRGHGLRHVPGHFQHFDEPLQESLLALLQFLADPG
jgi:hypothetical protein